MKLHRHSAILIAALCLGLGAIPNAAARHRWTDGMPGTKFNDEDLALMMARVNQALPTEKEGETFEWKNDKTPASGRVTALNRLQWNGLQCRRLRIHNAYGNLQAEGVYKFCEKPPGKWKLVGPD